MKKLFTCLLVCILVLLPFKETHAVGTPKIAGLNARYWELPSNRSFTMPFVEESFGGDGLRVNPGNELILVLPPEAFVDTSGTPVNRDDMPVITAAQMDEAKISVKVRTEAGAQALESVSIKDGVNQSGAYISVQFVKHIPSVRETGFDYTITLVSEGQDGGNVEIKMSGIISNPVLEVNAGDRFADLSRGEIAEAKAYVKNINVYIGNGVTVRSIFYEGSRYYGISSIMFAEDGVPLIELYPEIEVIYLLQTIGLKSSRECVSFDLEGRYFVYNTDGEYLGTSDKMVRYSSRYYLTTKKLDKINVFEL